MKGEEDEIRLKSSRIEVRGMPITRAHTPPTRNNLLLFTPVSFSDYE